MKEDMASIVGAGSIKRVEVRRSINAPIERVWSALTRAEEISRWWQPAEFEAVEGGRVKVFFEEGADAFVNGTVKVLQRPNVLEFTWNDKDENPGLVRFDLVQESPERTLVTLIQFVPQTEEIPASAGWHDIMDRLLRYIERGEVGETRFRELMELYQS